MNFDFLESDIGVIKETKKISLNCYYIEASDKYILKQAVKNIEASYDYLKSQNVSNIIYPLKKYKVDNNIFLLYPYIEEWKYPNDKKIFDLRDSIINVHESTKILKEVKKNNYKYLYRLYKKLDNKFRILDSFINEIELKEINDDFDWIILSKYHIFLDVKKEMYRLQTKIHEDIDKHISIFYCVNHGRPSLSHLVDKSLISFEESRFSFLVSDIARFYCINDYIKIDWYELINNWLNIYSLPIYKTYFKFLSLYIFIMNLHICDNGIYNYVEISNHLQRIMVLFSDF